MRHRVKRYQTPQRFFTGDEVSVIGGGNEKKVRHQIVTNAGPLKVTLDDGSEWRQSGLKWGTDDERWSVWRPVLVTRENGVAFENTAKTENSIRSIESRFRELLDLVSKTNPTYNIDDCLQKCEALSNYVRSLKG